MKTDMWKDNKGRLIEVSTMSDRWLNNIRKKFKGNPISEPIITEIERRKQIRRKPCQ